MDGWMDGWIDIDIDIEIEIDRQGRRSTEAHYAAGLSFIVAAHSGIKCDFEQEAPQILRGNIPLTAKQLEAKEKELKKHETYYKEQLNRLEERN
ncbi:hypothetical protein L345_16696, partial [Ophiophagus hannah]